MVPEAAQALRELREERIKLRQYGMRHLYTAQMMDTIVTNKARRQCQMELKVQVLLVGWHLEYVYVFFISNRGNSVSTWWGWVTCSIISASEWINRFVFRYFFLLLAWPGINMLALSDSLKGRILPLFLAGASFSFYHW